MKKLFFIILSVFCLTACAGNSKNLELVYGEWEIEDNDPTAWNVYSYTFYENNKVEYYECLDLTISLNTNGNDGCEKGSSVWIGKYSLKDNIITITDMKVDKNDSYNPTGILNGPSEKLIVNFDNMYMCDRDKGLDCDMTFEKN